MPFNKKLFGRGEPARPEVAAALDQITRAAEANPPFADAASLQSTILRIIYASEPQVGSLALDPERAAAKLRGGTPLLRGERLPLQMLMIRELLIRLCHALRERQDVGRAASTIAGAVKRRALAVEALVADALDGRADAIQAQAEALDLDGEMLRTLLRFSLFPALVKLNAQLAPLRAAAPWPRGYCPACGSWPLLGEHRGLEQTRFLRCGLCASEWAVDRLLCPFCGSRDHADLGYLHVEGQDQRRAATCERCRGYIKVLATLVPIPPVELIAQDLATMHLDMVALERGYMPPG